MSNETQQWWQTLQVGDWVILEKSGYAGYVRVARVSRLTPTQIIVGAEKYAPRFRKSTGDEIGGDTWRSVHLLPYTEEAAQLIRCAQFQGKLLRWAQLLRASALDALTIEQCQEIFACLQKHGLMEKERADA